MVSRRAALRTGITGIFLTSGIASASKTSGSSDDLDYEEYYESIVEKYGDREARVVTDIVREKYEEKRKRGWDQHKTHGEIKIAVLNDDETPLGSRELHEIDALRSQHSTLTHQSEVQIHDDETYGPNRVGSDDHEVTTLYHDTDTYTNYNAQARAYYSHFGTDTAHVESNVSMFGNCYAWAHCYGKWTVDNTGTHTVTADYYRRCYIALSPVSEVKLFIRKPGQGKIYKTLESIYSGKDGNTVRSTNFYMESGVDYDVGFELYTSADTVWEPAVWADFYNNSLSGQRMIRLNQLKVD